MGLLDDAKNLANSDKGENISDSAIEKGEGLASDRTGGKFDDKIESAGDAADDRIGN